MKKADWCMRISNACESWERKDIGQGWAKEGLKKFAASRKTQIVELGLNSNGAENKFKKGGEIK